MRERLGVTGMECLTCGAVSLVHITRARRGGGRYCSCPCAGKRNRLGSNNPNWRGGRIKGPEGRIVVYAPGHPGANLFGGSHILEYRLLIEKKIGRHLRSDEIVHHVNGDKHDNRLSNLQVMSRADHAREHFIGCRRPDKMKFSDAVVRSARREVAAGATQVTVAKKYGMAEGTLSKIIRNKARTNV